MKVLIVTKLLKAGGGATLVTTLVVDALLKMNCEVKVVCLDADPIEAFKTWQGIDLNHSNLTIEKVDTWISRRLQWSGYLDSFYLMHFVRKQKYPDHVLFSTWDEMDLGRKSLQYIHWISHHPKTHNGSKEGSDPWFRTLYRTLVSRLFGYNRDRVKHNISIFNSHLTERQFESLYGGSTGAVIYPPVFFKGKITNTAFSKRENGFVYSGRVVRDKNIHLMIEFLKRVRADGSDLHFHIVGPIQDAAYRNDLVRNYPYNWITFEGNKNRAELSKILGDHKYAIQGRYLEPFGMAAAEACRMGCITFVPRRSGLAELLQEDSLVFDNFSDLYNNFSVLQFRQDLQKKISDRLQERFAELTPEAFQNQIQRIFLKTAENIHA